MNNTKTLLTLLEATLCSTVFIVLLGVTTNLLYTKSISALEDQIKTGLTSTISASAASLNGTRHAQFDEDTQATDTDYQAAARHMERIRQATSDVRYIYTCILDKDVVYFMVNPSPQNDANGDGVVDKPPALMTPYHDAPPELKTALQEQIVTASTVPYKDQWGRFISAYSPFYDSHGKFVGVLAMDLELSRFYARLASIERVFNKAKIIILFLGLIVGLTIWWIRRSHVNHLHINAMKESDSAARLSLADNLNVTLSNLTHHFYQQCASIEHSDTVQATKLTALHQYAQSLKPITLVQSKHAIQDWFQALDSAVNARCDGYHKWVIPIETDVLFPCDTFAKELVALHHKLSDLLQIPLTANTSMTSEWLDGWQLTTQFQPTPVFETSSPALSILDKLFENGDHHTLYLTIITDFTEAQINIVTTINRLRLMGCRFTSQDNGHIEFQWSIFKEKAE